MANFSNSIDLNVFAACKVAEISSSVLKSPIQPLLLSGPGMGKSTAVQMYAEIAGYELVMLRGNSTSPEVVQGFDVAPTDTTKQDSTKHLRPTWFQTVLDNHAKGKKTLLFLDEISTANEYVQSALLQLILERKCDTELLPEDTLIISAANYSNNLSNTMVMLPPLLNRFMIINIIPTHKDLPHFLSKYEGSATGNRVDFKEEIKKQMELMNKQQVKDPTPDFINKIGEMIERCILDESNLLCKEGKLDLGVSDLKDLYQDVEGKDPLPGFVTMRTLNFARDMAISSYLAFGKPGLVSDNFKNQLLGLIGIALSYTGKNNDLQKTVVYNRYADAIAEVANDIEKMGNDRLPEYQNFITDIMNACAKKSGKKNGGSVMEIGNINLLSSKIRDLIADQELKDIDRPLDPAILKGLFSNVVETVRSNFNSYTKEQQKSSVAENVKENPEAFISLVNVWNQSIGLISAMEDLVTNSTKRYNQEIKDNLAETKEQVRPMVYKIKTIHKAVQTTYPDLGKIIPAIKSN